MAARSLIRGGHDSRVELDTGAGLGGHGGEGGELGIEGDETLESRENDLTLDEVSQVADDARKAAHRVEMGLSRLRNSLYPRPDNDDDKPDGDGRRLLVSPSKVKAGRTYKHGS